MPAVYPFAARLARWLLPNHCCLCGCPAQDVVCGPCEAQFVLVRRRRCRRCANPVDAGSWCGRCLSDPPAFDHALAAVDYASPLDQLVLQLKFASKLALAPWCAKVMRDVVADCQHTGLPDVLCPVPLGPQRLAERGFNQSLEIARPLAAMLGVALEARLVWRVVETLPQSTLAPGARVGNVSKAFTLAPGASVQGKHIGIVDDVMTSGHTAQAIAAMLKRFGAEQVTVVVFARTPPK